MLFERVGKYNIWIYACFSQFAAKDLDMPPGTAGIVARLVWVALMLKLEMEAQPMHPLEYLV
jgi:hypothetical protein